MALTAVVPLAGRPLAPSDQIQVDRVCAHRVSWSGMCSAVDLAHHPLAQPPSDAARVAPPCKNPWHEAASLHQELECQSQGRPRQMREKSSHVEGTSQAHNRHDTLHK